MKHSNIAVFIPHSGCPNRCSFCDQKTVSGCQKPPSPEEVDRILSDAIHSVRFPEQTEIAYFGGSFTAVDPDYRKALLEVAAYYVRRYSLYGVRISTRPDVISEAILEELKENEVRVIELGAQSMSADVLLLNERGHTPEDVYSASRLIHQRGFHLGLQMMTGLYGSTKKDDRKTAERFITLNPSFVRIYPTLTLEGTKLAALYKEGVFTPQTLSEAVEQCGELLETFHKSGIPVIRLGLHPSAELERKIVAGPYHPAFRELCESEMMFRTAEKLLAAVPRGEAVLWVSPDCISRMIGQKKNNLRRFSENGYRVTVKSDTSLSKYEIKLT